MQGALCLKNNVFNICKNFLVTNYKVFAGKYFLTVLYDAFKKQLNLKI